MAFVNPEQGKVEMRFDSTGALFGRSNSVAEIEVSPAGGVVTPFDDGSFIVAPTGGDYTTVKEALDVLTTQAGVHIIKLYGRVLETADMSYPACVCDEIIIEMQSAAGWGVESITMNKGLTIHGAGASRSILPSVEFQEDAVVYPRYLVLEYLAIGGVATKGAKPILTSTNFTKISHCTVTYDPLLVITSDDAVTIDHTSLLDGNGNANADVDVNGLSHISLKHSSFGELQHASGLALSAYQIGFCEIDALVNVTLPAGNFSNTVQGITNPVP